MLRRGERVAVIGRTVQREVFRGENPLGKAVRIGEYRLRVIGVLARKGRSLGIDIDDVVDRTGGDRACGCSTRRACSASSPRPTPEAVERRSRQVQTHPDRASRQRRGLHHYHPGRDADHLPVDHRRH